MNRPDEIAALADRLEKLSKVGFGYDINDTDRSVLRKSATELRLRATSPGDAVRMREALEKINEVRNSIIGTQSLNWSEHVYPLVAALQAAGFEGMEYPAAREYYGTLVERCVKAEDALAALAPAEKAGDELKVACASCKKIPGPHCQRPTCAFRDYIDTRTVKTVLAMTSSELSVIPASAVESGREMARQAIAATPTPPSADVALLRHLSGCARAFLQHFNPCDLAEDKAQQWQALEHQCDLADAAIQSAAATPPSADVARLVRDIDDQDIRDLLSAKDVGSGRGILTRLLRELIQSAAHGGGTKGGEV